MSETEWRTIDSAPKDGRSYEVSRDGDFRVSGKPRRPWFSDTGYARVFMGGKSASLHRLVAIAFIDNAHAKPEVNHKDGVKANNSAENLEWCTRSENMAHAYATGLHPGVSLSGPDSPNYGKTGSHHHQSKPVRAVFPDGRMRDYPCLNATASDGFRPNKVSLCINGHKKHHGGVKWMPLPLPPKEPEA